jgi:hypothetical protein
MPDARNRKPRVFVRALSTACPRLVQSPTGDIQIAVNVRVMFDRRSAYGRFLKKVFSGCQRTEKQRKLYQNVAQMSRYFICATGPHCEIALKSSGKVANDWPRYCGLKPKRIILPLPMVNSTSAAFPAIFSAPRAQPERSICFGSFG